MAISAVFKGLADENRLRIACLLTQADLCVCELADALELHQSTLSNHLAKMRDTGLVETTKDGTWIYYRLASAPRKALELFRDDLQKDRGLQADNSRLKKRLEMRIEGKCYRSYGQLKENS